MNIFRLYNKFAAYRQNQKTTARNPQHNDFYIVEFPKSGITWLSTILANMALISSGRKEVASFTAVHLFVPDIHVTRNLGPIVYNIPPVRMIKSHSEFNPNYAFVVYLTRHPIDVMKSYYRFNMENGAPEFLSFDDFCRSDKLGAQAWKQHVRSWLDGKVIAQRVHLCRYEDLIKDTDGEIELISRNFGWNIDSGIIKLAYGGVSRYFTRLAEGLLDSEQQVGIFAPVHRNNYLPTLPPGIINGRHINRYPPKTMRLILAYNQFRSPPQIAGWKPDLVHETYYSRASSAPKSCPAVITVFDMIHELFPKEFPINDNTAAIKRIAIERADHVLCISENTKSDLMRLHGTQASKLSVVHLGFDQFISRQDLLSPNTFSGKPFLLYVGQRGGYKNFAGFLKAVASSKRLLSDFDVVAFGGSKFSTHELDLITSLGFAENQVQHKSGSDELLGSLYSTARAFVYPSHYEGFGIPPLEAMAHNCPVISSNTSSMPEVIGNAGEYFDPNDTDDMRRAIEAVVYFDSCVEELKKSGIERLSAFSWDKCTQETLDIYQSLMGWGRVSNKNQNSKVG